MHERDGRQQIYPRESCVCFPTKLLELVWFTFVFVSFGLNNISILVYQVLLGFVSIIVQDTSRVEKHFNNILSYLELVETNSVDA
jgi:hypothetical protein